MPNLHDLRINGWRRRRFEDRRRTTPPWVVVLLVAMMMFLAGIGLTITVAFGLDHRITTIELFLDIREE